MPDRYVLQLKTAWASNTGGPYTATWDRTVVPSPGTIRSVHAVATSLSSNARVNTVDIYRQANAPAAGSNTATSILVTPITLVNDKASGTGSIAHSGFRVAENDILELRTDAATAAAIQSFQNLTATIEIERD